MISNMCYMLLVNLVHNGYSFSHLNLLMHSILVTWYCEHDHFSLPWRRRNKILRLIVWWTCTIWYARCISKKLREKLRQGNVTRSYFLNFVTNILIIFKKLLQISRHSILLLFEIIQCNDLINNSGCKIHLWCDLIIVYLCLRCFKFSFAINN